MIKFASFLSTPFSNINVKQSLRTRQPHGWCAPLQIERPGLEPSPETLHYAFGHEILLSQCLSPPRFITGYGKFNAGNNPAMDQHPIQGGLEMLLVTSCYRNRCKLPPCELLGSYADFTCTRRKMPFTIFKYLFPFQRYSRF